jgi:hypothetical protein
MIELIIKKNVMELRKTNRSHAKIRLAIQGPSRSGKTYSSLLLAHGLCNDWNKIAVIDTENKSADLYSHLGDYNVITLTAPFTPERYAEALDKCENSGMEVIIIDSLSHEWEGDGGILDTHAQMAGNSFTNWSKITPRHNALVQRILNSNTHVIATVRSKQDYVLTERNGKQVPEKVGMKGIQRDGLEYDFTIVFELDISNYAKCTKDRTQQFSKNIPYKIDEKIGELIKKWFLVIKPENDRNLNVLINTCKTVDALKILYNTNNMAKGNEVLFQKRAEQIKREEEVQKYLLSRSNGNAS